jgi:hypothetical protein
MKAKLYKFQDKLELKFSDDTLYYPKKNESEEAFVDRIQAVAANDYLDDEWDLVVIDKEVVATNSDADLQEAFKKADGLQKKLIEAVLTDRGLMNVKRPNALPREKVEKQSVEDMKATDHYKEHEANIGKYVSFSPFKKTDVFEGKIAGVALNKTNTIVYYTVVEADGKRRCCAVLNESIKFIEAPKTAEVVETKKPTSKDKKNQPGDAPDATKADKK